MLLSTRGGITQKTQELIQKIFQDAFDAGSSFEEIDASLHEERSCGDEVFQKTDPGAGVHAF